MTRTKNEFKIDKSSSDFVFFFKRLLMSLHLMLGNTLDISIITDFFLQTDKLFGCFLVKLILSWHSNKERHQMPHQRLKNSPTPAEKSRHVHVRGLRVCVCTSVRACEAVKSIKAVEVECRRGEKFFFVGPAILYRTLFFEFLTPKQLWPTIYISVEKCFFIFKVLFDKSQIFKHVYDLKNLNNKKVNKTRLLILSKKSFRFYLITYETSKKQIYLQES